MVDSTDTNATAGLNRLITFELDDDETLLVRAGRDELDNRTIYRGRVGGRFAIVPVEELTRGRATRFRDTERRLDLEHLGVVGEAVTTDGKEWVGLHAAGEPVERMNRPGAYSLLWVPFERK